MVTFFTKRFVQKQATRSSISTAKFTSVAIKGCFKHLSYNTANVVIHRGLIALYENYTHKY